MRHGGDLAQGGESEDGTKETWEELGGTFCKQVE